MPDRLKDLFIFEMANNHQGDTTHGKRIIDEVAAVCRKHGLNGAVKFQLRQLDTFIHPDYRGYAGNKHIKRFLETEMPRAGFAELVAATRAAGLVPMSTVFDEDSIPVFQELGMEILKIGSCSATDYPLLRALRKIDGPVILSTASLTLEEVERAVWVLDRKPGELAIMHCVGLYPTENNDLMLDRITELRRRFPGHRIGFSTHEHPGALAPVQVASALGATIFEKHVGIATDKYAVNTYSASPEALDLWAKAYREGLAMREFTPARARELRGRERSQIESLERVAFLRKAAREGDVLLSDSLSYAIPRLQGQASAAETEGAEIIADRDYRIGAPLQREAIVGKLPDGGDAVLMEYTRLTRAAGIELPEGMEADVSCHFGVEKLAEHGALLVTMFNESVCKKLIVLSAGQVHPVHRHSDREEFMRTLHGDAELQYQQKWTAIPAKDHCRIQKDEWHALRSKGGGVIEEITTHYGGARSEYSDPAVRSNKLKAVWRGNRWRWVAKA